MPAFPFRRRPAYVAYTAVPAAALLLLTAVAVLWQPHTAARAAEEPASNTPEFYTAKVEPILQANCARCHGGMNHRGGLSLETRAGMLKGGHDGTVLVPGHPEQSLLIKLIRHEGPANDPMPMPPRGKLSDADIAVVTQWIAAGALVPDPPSVR